MSAINLMQAFYFDSVESTNDLARAMVSDGRIGGKAYILAREQTAGRGNRGRSWASPRDAGIYMSIVDRPALPAMEALHAFTRAAGIAVAESLREQVQLAVELKPINDLYFRGRKLGGILTEAVIERQQLQALITGIGLNVGMAEREVRDGRVEPVCIEEIVPAAQFALINVQALVNRIVALVLHWNQIVCEGQLKVLEEHWSRYGTEEGSQSPD